MLPKTDDASERRSAWGSHAGEVLEPLTERNRGVAMVASGATNRAIGRTLHISERTVQGHIANIFGKLQGQPDGGRYQGPAVGLIKLPGAGT
jgi:DNA-binding NarL/FixJ family response regulator